MKLLRSILTTLMPLSLVAVLAVSAPALSAAVRTVEARNTDLTRFLPADGNTVYPATSSAACFISAIPTGGIIPAVSTASARREPLTIQ